MEDPKDWLTYDPETGALKWKRKQKGLARSRLGRAGSLTAAGYLQITVGQKNYLGHRLAWYLHHGSWPPHTLDHINGVRTDNRLVNLRLATTSQNAMNRGAPKNNTSGIKGVCWDKSKKRWLVQIKRVGVNSKFVGRFKTKEEAAEAYREAAAKVHGDFAWGGL